MLALVLLVFSIGIVDSINPSTVAPALYLASGAHAARSLGGFVVGVFCINLVGGLVLALGPGQALLAVVHRPGPRAAHLLELGLGAAMAALAVALWLGRGHITRHLVKSRERANRSSLLLGAGIMAAELPTAFPYFAAIAAIVGSGRGVVTQILLLVLFNAAFVAPLLVILGLRSLAGERGERWVGQLRSWLDRRVGTLLTAIVLVIAVALLLVGGVGLATS